MSTDNYENMIQKIVEIRRNYMDKLSRPLGNDELLDIVNSVFGEKLMPNSKEVGRQREISVMVQNELTNKGDDVKAIESLDKWNKEQLEITSSDVEKKPFLLERIAGYDLSNVMRLVEKPKMFYLSLHSGNAVATTNGQLIWKVIRTGNTSQTNGVVFAGGSSPGRIVGMRCCQFKIGIVCPDLGFPITSHAGTGKSVSVVGSISSSAQYSVITQSYNNTVLIEELSTNAILGRGGIKYHFAFYPLLISIDSVGGLTREYEYLPVGKPTRYIFNGPIEMPTTITMSFSDSYWPLHPGASGGSIQLFTRIEFEGY
jgi:hypothetical protein